MRIRHDIVNIYALGCTRETCQPRVWQRTLQAATPPTMSLCLIKVCTFSSCYQEPGEKRCYQEPGKAATHFSAQHRHRTEGTDSPYETVGPRLPPDFSQVTCPARTVAARVLPSRCSITAFQGTRLKPLPSSSIAKRPLASITLRTVDAADALAVTDCMGLQAGFSGAMILPHVKITELLLEVDEWTGFNPALRASEIGGDPGQRPRTCC